METPFVRTTFFTPTDGQWELGARWAYCVVAYGAETIRPAPGPMEQAFAESPTAAYRRCTNLTDLTPVPCSQPHTDEYTGQQATYPPNPIPPLSNPTSLSQLADTCFDAGRRYAPDLGSADYESQAIFPPTEDYDPAVGVLVIDCVIVRADESLTTTSVRD